MSTFKKYLQIVNEAKNETSLAISDPKEIAKMNQQEMKQLAGEYAITKMDKEAEDFIKKIVKYVKDEIHDYPKLRVINITSKFVLPSTNPKAKHKFVSPSGNPRRLGENIKSENDAIKYKNDLVNRLAYKLNEMIDDEGYSEYLGPAQMADIKIVEANDGNSNALNYPWYAIDIDIEKMKQREWESTRKWSMKHDRPKPTQEQTDKWFRASNAAKHASIRAENERHKETIDNIRKNNEKNSYSLNMNKKANRDKVYGKGKK